MVEEMNTAFELRRMFGATLLFTNRLVMKEGEFPSVMNQME